MSNDKVSHIVNLIKKNMINFDETSHELSRLNFLQEQLNLIENIKQPRYSPYILMWACSIYYSYPAAYYFIRQTNVLTLPHPVYLKKLSLICLLYDVICIF